MELLSDLLLFFHLIFLSALLGGFFVSVTRKGLSNAVMLWGGRLQLLVGLALYGVVIARAANLGFEVNHMVYGMKIVIALVLVALIEMASAGQKRAGQWNAERAAGTAAVRAPMIYVAGALAVVNVILGMIA